MTADADRPADAAEDPRALTRAHFDHVVPATTRWSDNDMYGHLNNAVYYELFDSAINGWLITGAGVDVMALPELGVVAESGCRYFRELEYPARSTSASASNGSGAAASPTRWDSSTPRRTSPPRSATGSTSTSTAPHALHGADPLLRSASSSGAPNGPGA